MSKKLATVKLLGQEKPIARIHVRAVPLKGQRIEVQKGNSSSNYTIIEVAHVVFDLKDPPKEIEGLGIELIVRPYSEDDALAVQRLAQQT